LNGATAPHLLAHAAGLCLGTVTDTADPESRGRVRVRLASLAVELWASVSTLSAGAGYGVQLLPKRDALVVIAFVSPELPIVLGALWTGAAQPETEQAPVEDRFSVVTPAGTRITCDDAGQPTVTIETPAGNVFTLSDQRGGEAKVDVQGTSITVTSSKVTVQSSGNTEVNAAEVKVSAAQVSVDAGLSKFTGVVKCDVLQATTVVASTYTQGAGNLW
jgi:uncharacterized protein involved in type VI secretion and phage assembly